MTEEQKAGEFSTVGLGLELSTIVADLKSMESLDKPDSDSEADLILKQIGEPDLMSTDELAKWIKKKSHAYFLLTFEGGKFNS